MKATNHIFVLLLLLGSLGACTTTPDAEELPDDESQVQTVPSEEETTTNVVEEAPEPLIPVKRLKIKGVRGGSISFEVAGTPDEIADALLDFSGNADHRSWVKKFEAQPAEGSLTVARWHFEGKAGINPVVDLGFMRDGDSKARRIRYKLVKKDFGLGAFFGDYTIQAMADQARRSIVTERTFIDSGVWIANASYEEIEDGLREDAKLLVPWFEEKFGSAEKK